MMFTPVINGVVHGPVSTHECPRVGEVIHWPDDRQYEVVAVKHFIATERGANIRIPDVHLKAARY